MEDPSKAKAFDQLHKEGPKWGRQHAGAKELASGYTRGSYRMELIVAAFCVYAKSL